MLKRATCDRKRWRDGEVRKLVVNVAAKYF